MVSFYFEIERNDKPTPEDKNALALKVRKLMFFEKEVFQEIAHRHLRVIGILHSLIGEGINLLQTMALMKPLRIAKSFPKRSTTSTSPKPMARLPHAAPLACRIRFRPSPATPRKSQPRMRLAL